ncbi:unnamed protein product [Haemonchus placei]|uniref:Uncharacterized protein n=1 Tax=Haemonchus placei TaxID=6290 RepID=A0A3P7VKK1_HAEPC|nr:unnamed protein product [Haemonchus placei]
MERDSTHLGYQYPLPLLKKHHDKPPYALVIQKPSITLLNTPSSLYGYSVLRYQRKRTRPISHYQGRMVVNYRRLFVDLDNSSSSGHTSHYLLSRGIDTFCTSTLSSRVRWECDCVFLIKVFLRRACST